MMLPYISSKISTYLLSAFRLMSVSLTHKQKQGILRYQMKNEAADLGRIGLN
jgi:hypothetical protein